MLGGFRKSMAWLHTWTGLTVAWVLFFVFVTGTASYATQEITRWMQPEVPMPVNNPATSTQQFQYAFDYLSNNAESLEATRWNISLAHAGRVSGQLTAAWSSPVEGQRNVKTTSETLNAETGELMNIEIPRQTAGGRALLRMHFALHYMASKAGIWIVGICTMFMFVAIITGVITHKKIFKDFFTFRPQKGQRSWLDAHNLISVAALPFFIMITYSGLIFFMYTYMSLGVSVTHGFDEQAEQQYFQELRKEVGSNRLVGHVGPTMAMPQPERNAEGRGGRGRGNEPRFDKRMGAQNTQFADLTAIVQQVEAQWGNGNIRAITITSAQRPNDSAKISIAPLGSETVRRSRGGVPLEFNAMTGEPIPTADFEKPIPEIFGSSMLGLHEAHFANTALRWMFVFSGLLGCAMIATGLVLWTVKRRKQLSNQRHLGLWLVERLNIATLAGLPFGLAVYFWANRLLPVDMVGRNNWEIHCMFIAWLAISVLAFVRPVMRGWLECLSIAAAAFLLLPVVNAITTDKHLIATVVHGDWVRVSVEMVFIGVGLALAWAAIKVRTKIHITALPTQKKESVVASDVDQVAA